MNILLNVLSVILHVLVPMLLRRSPDTMEDAARQPQLRERLQKKIRATWSRTALTVILLLSICPMGGCAFQQTRTVYIQDGQPVRLRETIRNAKVWVPDKDGNPIAAVADLPEGWYCLALTDEPEGDALPALPPLPELPDIPAMQAMK